MLHHNEVFSIEIQRTASHLLLKNSYNTTLIPFKNEKVKNISP